MSKDRELESLRKKRMADLQAQAEAQTDNKAQQAEYEAQKAMILRQILTPEARDRLANIKMARPEFAESLESQLISLASKNAIRGQVTEDQLIEILKKLQSGKREGTIEFKRK